TAHENSPVEVTAPPSKSKSKPTRGRQKKTVQNEDAPWQTAWTNEEKIALCKGCVYVSENSRLGNTRKDARFWTGVLKYMESKTKMYCRRTYDMESEARDKDYYNRELLDYEVKTGVSFKLIDYAM
nr:hypothetical protein [Tanacetum cinerariifolium]